MSMLEGKRAIVTGGSRGIGRAIATAFAQEGARVAICYRTEDEAVGETMEALAAAGAAGAMAIRGDVSDHAFAREAAARIKEEFGGCDILVNNAGITADALMLRMKPEDWDRVIGANLSGAFYMTKEMSALMIKQRSGRIISLSSIVGVEGNAGQANYAASKAGIIGLTKSAAKELGSRGITANAIAPGLIDTRMTQALTGGQREAALGRIALGRPGEPREVAHLAVFLASANAAYITGQVIGIDGGMLI
jgi:3-oxoacyl-[acyl-carrier protein] reductase